MEVAFDGGEGGVIILQNKSQERVKNNPGIRNRYTYESLLGSFS